MSGSSRSNRIVRRPFCGVFANFQISPSPQGSVVPRGHLFKFCAGGIIGPLDIPEFCQNGGVLRAQAPERGPCTPTRSAARNRCKPSRRRQPNAMDMIVVVGIRIIGLSESASNWICASDSEEVTRAPGSFRRALVRRPSCRISRAIIGIVGDAHTSFCGGTSSGSRRCFSRTILRGNWEPGAEVRQCWS